VKPKLYKRVRRKLPNNNGKAEFRIYEDGSVRVRVDHPSNDPGIEIMLAGMILHDFRIAGEALGIVLKPSGPLVWKDDPA